MEKDIPAIILSHEMATALNNELDLLEKTHPEIAQFFTTATLIPLPDGTRYQFDKLDYSVLIAYLNALSSIHLPWSVTQLSILALLSPNSIKSEDIRYCTAKQTSKPCNSEEPTMTTMPQLKIRLTQGQVVQLSCEFGQIGTTHIAAQDRPVRDALGTMINCLIQQYDVLTGNTHIDGDTNSILALMKINRFLCTYGSISGSMGNLFPQSNKLAADLLLLGQGSVLREAVARLEQDQKTEYPNSPKTITLIHNERSFALLKSCYDELSSTTGPVVGIRERLRQLINVFLPSCDHPHSANGSSVTVECHGYLLHELASILELVSIPPFARRLFLRILDATANSPKSETFDLQMDDSVKQAEQYQVKIHFGENGVLDLNVPGEVKVISTKAIKIDPWRKDAPTLIGADTTVNEGVRPDNLQTSASPKRQPLLQSTKGIPSIAPIEKILDQILDVELTSEQRHQFLHRVVNLLNQRFPKRAVTYATTDILDEVAIEEVLKNILHKNLSSELRHLFFCQLANMLNVAFPEHQLVVARKSQ